MKNQVTKAATAAQEVAVPATGPSGLSSNITSQDLRLPRIALLQALSPQVQREPEKYKQGTYVDTLTQEVLGASIKFTPVFVFKNIIKWKPRTEGGGMLWKTINPTKEQLAETLWNGTEKPTADVYINCICLVEHNPVPLIISFCKTSLKAGQDLATLVTLSGSAWKFEYTLDTVRQTNSKGTFYVMRVKRGGMNSPEQQQQAAELYEQVKCMAIDTDYENDVEVSSESTGATPREF